MLTMRFLSESTGTAILGRSKVKRRGARTIFAVCLLAVQACVIPLDSARQITAAASPSPIDVIKEYWKMETSGGRLTLAGWYRATAFFIRSDIPPPTLDVLVVRDGSLDTFEVTARTDTWAEVRVNTDEIGQLDHSLRLNILPRVGPHGVDILRGPYIPFHVVLTTKHWEFRPDGTVGSEITSSPQWLIDCTENEDWVWVNEAAAVRYVTEARNKTTDPAIKKNADAALATLAKLH
jgi:hypothetical protein